MNCTLSSGSWLPLLTYRPQRDIYVQKMIAGLPSQALLQLTQLQLSWQQGSLSKTQPSPQLMACQQRQQQKMEKMVKTHAQKAEIHLLRISRSLVRMKERHGLERLRTHSEQTGYQL